MTAISVDGVDFYVQSLSFRRDSLDLGVNGVFANGDHDVVLAPRQPPRAALSGACASSYWRRGFETSKAQLIKVGTCRLHFLLQLMRIPVNYKGKFGRSVEELTDQ